MSSFGKAQTCVVLCCGLATVNIVVIYQAYFTGAEVIVIVTLKDLSKHNDNKNPRRNNNKDTTFMCIFLEVEWRTSASVK